MDSVKNTVHYCCVSKSNRAMYVYSGGNHENENLASLCLEKTPPFHKWYFETIGKRTFGFLIDDGFVYFTIVDEGLGNPSVLKFLEHLRDEFKKVAKKSSRGSFLGLNSVSVEEQLVPVVHRLINSLQNVSQGRNDGSADTTSSLHPALSPSPSNVNGQAEVANSTKAPLLGKSSKQEKKKAKDHVISLRDVELEERRKSTDRGLKAEATVDSANQSAPASATSLQKDLGSLRMRSGAQTIRRKWLRQVRLVLAIDAAICIILFVVWLAVCGGIECTRS